MKSKFRHVALIGKYQASAPRAAGPPSRAALEDMGALRRTQGWEVAREHYPPANTSLTRDPGLTAASFGAQWDLTRGVGGDAMRDAGFQPEGMRFVIDKILAN